MWNRWPIQTRRTRPLAFDYICKLIKRAYNLRLSRAYNYNNHDELQKGRGLLLRLNDRHLPLCLRPPNETSQSRND